MRIKAYFKGNAPREEQESGRKAGILSIFANVSKIARVPRPPAPSGHDERQAQPAPPRTLIAPTFQNIFDFCLFWSPKTPRKHQARPKNHLLLPIFARFVWKSDTMGAGKGLRKPDEIEPLCYIWRAYKKGHPPPVAERQVPFIPIIFRTKNTEKSRLGLIGKIFGKNL